MHGLLHLCTYPDEFVYIPLLRLRVARHVPRRKLNKNKGLSVPTKMATSLTPANVPASCGWQENCARRGLTLRVRLSSDRDAMGDLQTWCSGYVSVSGAENTLGYWIQGLLDQLWPIHFPSWVPVEHHACCSHSHGGWPCGAQWWGLQGPRAYGVKEHCPSILRD